MTTSAAAFKPQACGAMYDAAATDSPGSVSSSHDTPNGALLGGVRPPAASSGLAPRSLETAAFAPRAQVSPAPSPEAWRNRPATACGVEALGRGGMRGRNGQVARLQVGE